MTPEQRLQQATKRTFDLVVGVALCLVLLPMITVLALIVALQLRAWPFFVHERIGQHGRIIRFPKLRTLPRHTPRYALKNEFSINPPGRFMAFLRNRHIDELPQIFLVPLGRLSLVGPRPKMPDEFEPTPEAYRNARLLVPQGCTGLWQIGAHTSQIVHESPEYDFGYLQYGSLRLDLWILWRTVAQLFTNKGMGLQRIPRWALGKGFVTSEQLRTVGARDFMIAPDLMGTEALVRERRGDLLPEAALEASEL